MLATLVVFAITYVLIASRRMTLLPIGRPAGALVGAVGMVLVGVFDPVHGLGPDEALRAVEPSTIGMLFGMMVIAGALAEAGHFERAAGFVAERARSGPQLLWAITLASGVLSALVLNDSVCLLFAPIVARVAERRGLPKAPLVLGLACGANAGSAMTLAGNPQNMLVANLSGIPYRRYLLQVGPPALLALIATAAVLHLLFARALSTAAPPGPFEPAPGSIPAPGERPTIAPLVTLAAVSVGFLAGGHLAWTAIAGAAFAITWRRRDATPVFAHVSWMVLVFFGSLFVVVAGVEKSGLADAALHATTGTLPRGGAAEIVALSGVLLVACQLLSNVPTILLLEGWVHGAADPELAWMTVALVSTLAGNLTMLGSVANILAVEGAGAEKELGFRAHLRAGVPVTLVSTVVGVAALLAVRAT